MEQVQAQIKLTRRKLRGLVNSGAKSAEAVNLMYVNDTMAGITRISKNGKFIYKLANKVVKDKQQLDRIKKLVIPPAWQQVWICPYPNGHLQVTGYDVLNRKQYKYHNLWNALRNHTKYSQLYEFGRALPQIRTRLQKDLALPGLQLQKVLAAAVSIMQCTCIRVGNSEYEKLYGSFGLTTLKDQHVKIHGSEVKFAFKGKKGIYHNISLKSKKLAHIVKQCRDIPGKELFQYYDEHGERKAIDSGMINNYIKEISGGNFTAKDFRTWAGTLKAFEVFKEHGCCDTVTETKKRIVETLDIVAKHLGNTRTVCKKYYVHPSLIDQYTDQTISKYFRLNNDERCSEQTGLSSEEKILMKILQTGSTVMIQ